MGQVDPEIICLKWKKEQITEGKIYSPVGKFSERANNRRQGAQTTDSSEVQLQWAYGRFAVICSNRHCFMLQTSSLK